MNSGGMSLTFSKVLSGLSKTLGIANQVIPLYQQTKPLFKNARSAYEIIKGVKKIEPKTTEPSVTPYSGQSATLKKEQARDNTPQFFI